MLAYYSLPSQDLNHFIISNNMNTLFKAADKSLGQVVRTWSRYIATQY